MANVLPTKELVEMIEARIPGGRLLSTAALLLGLLAIIVAACVYLYHVVIYPLIVLVVAGFTTGKINPASFGSFIATALGGVVSFLILNYGLKRYQELMKDVLDNSRAVNENSGAVLRETETVLTLAKEASAQMVGVVEKIDDLEARVSALEK